MAARSADRLVVNRPVLPPAAPDAASLRDDQRARVLAQLFEAEFAYVWTCLRRLGVLAKDAEDLTHDVFLQVHAKLHLYDRTRPVRPWLFGFAYRVAADYRRRARNHREADDGAEEVAGDGPIADAVLETREEESLVQTALSTLAMDRRALLIAYEVDGAAMKDIAQVLEIPLHTAYSRLRVAREEFGAAVRRLQFQRGLR